MIQYTRPHLGSQFISRVWAWGSDLNRDEWSHFITGTFISNTRYVMYIITGSLHSVLLTFYEAMVMKAVSCYIALC